MKTDFFSQEIGRQALLTAEQEVELFKRLENGDQATREEIITANLRLVGFVIAKFFTNSPSPSGDLVQAGSIGLMRAVGKFDCRRGFRFSTFALAWIKQAIYQELNNHSGTIRLPAHIISQKSKLARETRQFAQILGRLPTDIEIASILGWSVEKLRAVKAASKDALSLNTPVSSADGDFTLMDVTADTRAEDPAAMAEAALLRRDIEDMLRFLPPRERVVLKMRHGFYNGRCLTLEQCGSRLKISREGVRQMEKSGLSRLRQHPRCQMLKAYL